MEELEAMFANISLVKFDLQSVHWVHVTHIDTPHDFYTRPTQYCAFIRKIELSKPRKRPQSLHEYDMVLFDTDRSGINARYARGVIHKVTNDENGAKYDLFAIDYGYFHRGVTRQYIFECNDLYLKIPCLAVQCQLANCAMLGGTSWSEESIDAFKHYIANERARMTVVDITYDKLIVELINSNDDISTLMALTGYSTLGYLNNVISRMPSAEVVGAKKIFYTFKDLHPNDKLHVRVQGGKSPEEFYVAEVNDYQNFMKDCDSLTYQARKQPKLSEDQLQVNTLVYVKNDMNKYDRGIILDIVIPKIKAVVKLVDYGKEEQAHILNMRPMTEQGLKMPVLAIFCKADYKQVLDNGLHRFLYPGFQYVIRVKTVGVGFHRPCSVDILPLPPADVYRDQY